MRLSPSTSRVGERGHEALPARFLLRRDLLAEVAGHLAENRQRRGRLRGHRRRLDSRGPVLELCQIGLRQAHQVDQHAQRDRHGDIGDEVASAALDDPIQHVGDDLAHPTLDRRDRARHEGRLQDLAVLGVLGRVLEQQQVAVYVERVDLVGVREDPGRVGRERLRVAACRRDRRVAAHRPEPVALRPRAGVGRRLGPQLVEESVRGPVGERLRIGEIRRGHRTLTRRPACTPRPLRHRRGRCCAGGRPSRPRPAGRRPCRAAAT